MRSLNALVWRNLIANPLRTILTALAITLGVGMVLAATIVGQAASQSATQLSEQGSQVDLEIFARDNSPFDQKTILDTLRSQPDVNHASPSLRVEAKTVDVAIGNLTLLGVEPESYQAIHKPELAGGAFLTAPDTIVLPVVIAIKHGLRVGDKITLKTGDQSATLTIVGRLKLKQNLTTLAETNTAFVPLAVAQRMVDTPGQIDRVAVSIPSGVDVEHVKAALTQQLDSTLAVALSTIGGGVQINTVVLQVGLLAVGIIILFAGGFVIMNAFLMTVAQRTRQIGMMRALGLTQGQVMRLVLLEAGVLGLLGSGLGLLTGLGLAWGVMFALNTLDETPFVVPWWGIVLSLLLGLGVTLVAALQPAWQASRISPLLAVRQSRSNTGHSWYLRRGSRAGLALLGLLLLTLLLIALLLRPNMWEAMIFVGISLVFLLAAMALMLPALIDLTGRVSRPLLLGRLGTPGRLAADSLSRNRLRSALTAGALTAALATITISSSFLSILLEGGMRTSIDLLHEDWIVTPNLTDQLATGQLSMKNFNYEAVWGTPLDPALLADLETLAETGQLQVEYMASAPIQPELSPTIGFPALFIDPEIFLDLGNFDFFEGDADSALALMRRGRAVLIQPIVAERFKVHVGDTILVQSPSGEIEVTVAGIGGTTWMVTIFSYQDGQDYFNISTPTVLGLVVPEGQDREAILAQINAIISRHSDWMLLEANQNGLEPMLNVINLFKRLLNALLFLAVIVAALGVINTMAINVAERQREIGLLRAVGATQHQIRRAIVLEGGLLGLTAALTATGLSLIFLLTLIIVSLPNSSVSLGLRADWETVIRILSLGLRDMGWASLFALIFGPLVAALAAYYPAKQAAAMDVVEATRSERVTLQRTPAKRPESGPKTKGMMSNLNFLALRNMEQSRSRTILSILAVTLGVGMVVAKDVIVSAIRSATQTASESQNNLPMMAEMGDLTGTIVGIIILIAAGFLVFNAFAMAVTQRRQQIGALRALGMVRRQVMQLVLVESLIIGGIGTLLGLAVGPLLGRGLIVLTRTVENLIGQTLGVFGQPSISIPNLVLAAGLGLVVTLLSTLLPAWQATRISPLAVLREEAQFRPRNSFSGLAWLGLAGLVSLTVYLVGAPPGRWTLPPWDGILSGIFVLGWVIGLGLILPAAVDIGAGLARKPLSQLWGATGRLIADNLGRNRRRVIVTILTLAIGLAMIVSITGIMTFFFEVLTMQMVKNAMDRRGWMVTRVDFVTDPVEAFGQMNLESMQLPAKLVAAVHEVADERADVAEAYMVFVPELAFLPGMYSFVGETQQLISLGGAGFTFYAGDWETATPILESDSGCGLLLTPIVARRNSVWLYDTLTIEGVNGPIECTVAGIGTSSHLNVSLISIAAGEALGIENPAWLVIFPYPGVERAQLEADLIEVVRPYSPQAWLRDFNSTIGPMLGTFKILQSMMNALLLLAILAAAMGVINTTVMSVNERRRELGLLRAVGTTRRQITAIVTGEAALIGFMGGGLGLVVGVGITVIFAVTYGGNAWGIKDLPPWPSAWEAVQPALLTGLLGLLVAPFISAGAAWFPVRAVLHGPAIETMQPERQQTVSPGKVAARIWSWGSIRTRFVVGSGVLLLLVLGGLTEVVTRHEQNNLEDLLHDTLTTLVEGQASLIELHLPPKAQTLGLTDFQIASFNPEDLLRFKVLVDDMSARGLESFTVVDQNNVVLLSLDPSQIGGSVPALESSNETLVTLERDGDEWQMPATTPIRNEAGQVIGSVRLTLNLAEVQSFLRETRNTLWGIGSGIIALGLILSWLLVTPLVIVTRQLTDHVAGLAQGEYKPFNQTGQRYWLPAFIRRTSLRTRLTMVMVLIVILLVGILEVLVIPLERRHIESTVQDNMLSAATWMGQAVSESLTPEFSVTIQADLPALEQMLERGQTLDLAKLQSLIQQTQTDDIAYIALVDKKGVIQLSDQLALIGKTASVFAETQIEADRWRDEAIWAVSTPIRYGQDGEQLGVLRLGVRRVRIETFLKESQSLFRLTGLIAILAGILLAQAISGAVTAPMRELTAGTRRGADGDFEAEINPKEIQTINDYILKPLEAIPIDQTVADNFSKAKYQVTTVVSLAEESHKNIYIVDQTDLGNLLAGYSEYAEFIVEIVEIDPE